MANYCEYTDSTEEERNDTTPQNFNPVRRSYRNTERRVAVTASNTVRTGSSISPTNDLPQIEVGASTVSEQTAYYDQTRQDEPRSSSDNLTGFFWNQENGSNESVDLRTQKSISEPENLSVHSVRSWPFEKNRSQLTASGTIPECVDQPTINHASPISRRCEDHCDLLPYGQSSYGMQKTCHFPMREQTITNPIEKKVITPAEITVPTNPTTSALMKEKNIRVGCTALNRSQFQTKQKLLPLYLNRAEIGGSIENGEIPRLKNGDCNYMSWSLPPKNQANSSFQQKLHEHVHLLPMKRSPNVTKQPIKLHTDENSTPRAQIFLKKYEHLELKRAKKQARDQEACMVMPENEQSQEPDHRTKIEDVDNVSLTRRLFNKRKLRQEECHVKSPTYQIRATGALHKDWQHISKLTEGLQELQNSENVASSSHLHNLSKDRYSEEDDSRPVYSTIDARKFKEPGEIILEGNKSQKCCDDCRESTTMLFPWNGKQICDFCTGRQWEQQQRLENSKASTPISESYMKRKLVCSACKEVCILSISFKQCEWCAREFCSEICLLHHHCGLRAF